MNEISIEELRRAQRLAEMGVIIRSPELHTAAEQYAHFQQHGNRQLRRAAKRATRGSGKTKSRSS